MSTKRVIATKKPKFNPAKIFLFIFGRAFWIALLILVEVAVVVGALLIALGVIEYNGFIPPQVVPYIVLALLFIFTFAVVISIVNSKSIPAYKLTWLSIVALLPFLGPTFYILFGGKNTTKRQRKQIDVFINAINRIKRDGDIDAVVQEYDPRGQGVLNLSNYIESETNIPMYAYTKPTYFTNGETAFPVMIEELKKAKHYIFMEYFIIQKGKFWNLILEVLKQKAQEGLDVRVLYDDIGSMGTLPFTFTRKLKKLGIKCCAFNRFKPVLSVRFNNRDHRKILVIDGHTGFTGGINLADEYINEVNRFGYWLDNCIMIKGKAVHGLTSMFLTSWCVSNKSDPAEISDPKYLSTKYLEETTPFEVDGGIQPYGDIPFDDSNVGQRVYVNIANAAQEYLYITTPYLILDDETENALINAARRGVDVHIVTPHIPDKKMVFNVTRSFYGNLIENGVKIHEYTPGFIHEKIFICDGRIATVGTINLDYRSLYLHLENGLLIYGSSVIEDMVADYKQTLEESELITKWKFMQLKKHKKFLWALLRIFSPLM